MAPATRTIASTSHNEDGDVGGLNRSFQEMMLKDGSLDVSNSSLLMKFFRIRSEIRKIKYQTNAKEYQDAFDTLLSRWILVRNMLLGYFGNYQEEEQNSGEFSAGLLGGMEEVITNPSETDETKGVSGDSKGVATDPTKIKAIQEWPIPSIVKQLRGFLGLTRYYRRFIMNFASVTRPLTQLLKKGGYKCTDEAQTAFETLKSAMQKAPVLALPDFTKPFEVETDASEVGLGAVLQQNGNPIAYMSKTLSLKHQSLSTYEKEFLAVLLALEKWRGYLLDRHFIIRTYHFSLKYFLDQKITTPTQMKCLPKLIGFDYEVVYKKRSDNGATDALSRVQTSELFSMVTTLVSTDLAKKIEASWLADDKLQALILKLQAVGNDPELRKELLQYFYGGVKCKPDLAAYPGLLQPLLIPNNIWTSISMDFIEGLPQVTREEFAQAILDNVCKLHGMPESIVSDRDKATPFEYVYEIPLPVIWNLKLKGYKGEVPSG
ncbi:transposon ty3-G gag-pol polyprotein [Tanacetum coccineum]